ncbi:M15 family metallopeptidase [Anaerobacillus sp. CMMVII]|nr:M15 family metallopeptidase [Anaerobacillus sp. CMMVII]MCT8137561.1 M15 family metallopeptidase [Anaerobacillus sp. CMMVII]
MNFTNKNLTTGKTYHYKVRAFRTVNGKKVYSIFSDILKQKIPYPVVNRSLETLRLVDKQNGLPKDFVPKDLITPNVRFSTSVAERRKMTREAGRALEKMFRDANKAGIVLYAQSGYRSYATQQSIYQSYVKRYGQNETDKFSARPGHSEHQTGLAMDITSKSVNFNLTEKFAETKKENG